MRAISLRGVIDSGSDPDDTELAVAAARAGAAIVRAGFGERLARVDKGAGDFATAADIESERAIVGVIRAARPDDALLGEEGGRQGAAGAERQWLVDPLCGTLNHAAGMLCVAVNVALLGGPAAVADPFADEVFLTDGRSARVRRDGADAPLTPTSATRLVDVNLDPPFPGAPAFRATDVLAHPVFIERFRPRVVSTSLALAWVAAGRRAAYVTDGGDLSESVHFAAGIALCRAAGCVVTGIDGAPVGQGARGLVAAADADTHALLMSIIHGAPGSGDGGPRGGRRRAPRRPGRRQRTRRSLVQPDQPRSSSSSMSLRAGGTASKASASISRANDGSTPVSST